jgi:hypothetical protein
MLPDHPLLRPTLLHSVRSGTIFDPDTLVLRFGEYTPTNVVYPEHAKQLYPEKANEPLLLRDDSLITTLHEGIHWRQLHGTTLGAFLSWLKHAREIDTFQKLYDLPPSRRAALLRARRAGQPLLSLNDEGLPDPPIVLGNPVNEAELLRCTFFDNFLLSRLFTDPVPIIRPHARFEEIFESVMADAATVMARYHPAWDTHSYKAIQRAYRLYETPRRLQVDDPYDESGANRVELTTHDVMEAGAVANELLLGAFTREQRYYAPGSEPTSVWSPETELEPERFRNNAAWYLRSGHGVALREFFVATRLDSEFVYPWVTVAAVTDFALNPPLPPIVGPQSTPLSWRDVYPPLRFALAARAVKWLGPLSNKPTAAEVAAFQRALDLLDAFAHSDRIEPLYVR